MNPRASEADTGTEQSALEDAIKRIEREAAQNNHIFFAITALTAVLVLLVGGLTFWFTFDPGKPTSASAEAAVKAYFGPRLFDGETARYRFITPPLHGWIDLKADDAHYFDNFQSAEHKDLAWYICGEVNAKNRLGAYVGEHFFFAQLSSIAPYQVVGGEIADNNAVAHKMDLWCTGLMLQNPELFTRLPGAK